MFIETVLDYSVGLCRFKTFSSRWYVQFFLSPLILGFRPSCHCASCCPVKQKPTHQCFSRSNHFDSSILRRACLWSSCNSLRAFRMKNCPLAWTLTFDERLNNVGKHEFNALKTLGFVARYGLDMEIQWATCWKPDDFSFWVHVT